MPKPGEGGRAIWDARLRRQLQAGQLALEELTPYQREDWNTDHWETPWPLIHDLEEEFGIFELDPCATERSAKAARYFTESEDGLSQPWAPCRVFCNPPYSCIEPWLRKAGEEARQGALVVALIPVRSDQDWWHDLVLPFAELRFLRGRQRFIGADGTTIGR